MCNTVYGVVSCDCWSVLAPLNTLQINSLLHHLIQRTGREGGKEREQEHIQWYIISAIIIIILYIIIGVQ